MRSVVMPPARPVQWRLRPKESARITVRTPGSGELQVTIEHAPLGGVTPEMLAWWYGNVMGTMPYVDAMYPRYLVWHPFDHISCEVVKPPANGRVAPGCDR